MLKKTTASLLASLACLAVGSSASAATITLTHDGTGDVFLRQSQATTNQGDTRNIFGSQGTGQEFVMLMNFSLADLTTAAGGSPITINSVTLNMGPAMTTVTVLGATGFEGQLSTYTAFNHADATWNDPDGSAGSDATAGGTAGTALSTETFAAGEAARSFGTSAAFVAYLQAAFDGSTDVNFHLSSNETTTNTLLRTDAGAVTGTGQGTLEIDYTVIPEPGSLALLSLGGLLVARRRRG